MLSSIDLQTTDRIECYVLNLICFDSLPAESEVRSFKTPFSPEQIGVAELRFVNRETTYPAFARQRPVLRCYRSARATHRPCLFSSSRQCCFCEGCRPRAVFCGSPLSIKSLAPHSGISTPQAHRNQASKLQPAQQRLSGKVEEGARCL